MDFSFFRHVSFLIGLEVACFFFSEQKELTQDYKSKYLKQSLSEQATLSVGRRWSTWCRSLFFFFFVILIFLQKTLPIFASKILFKYKAHLLLSQRQNYLIISLKHGHPKDLGKKQNKQRFNLQGGMNKSTSYKLLQPFRWQHCVQMNR